MYTVGLAVFGLRHSPSSISLRLTQTSPNSSQSCKKKRSWSRAVFSNLQRKGLEKRFEVQKYVTKPDRRQLAAMLGLTDAQVSEYHDNDDDKHDDVDDSVNVNKIIINHKFVIA